MERTSTPQSKRSLGVDQDMTPLATPCGDDGDLGGRSEVDSVNPDMRTEAVPERSRLDELRTDELAQQRHILLDRVAGGAGRVSPHIRSIRVSRDISVPDTAIHASRRLAPRRVIARSSPSTMTDNVVRTRTSHIGSCMGLPSFSDRSASCHTVSEPAGAPATDHARSEDMHRIRWGYVIVMVAVVAAACSSSSGDLEDEIVERIVEQTASASGGDVTVDLDTDTGGFTVETEDGSIAFGGDSDLGLPDELATPVPDGGVVTHQIVSDDLVSVAVQYERSRFDELVSFYDGSLPGATRSEQTWEDAVGAAFASTSWYEDEISVTVTTCFGPTAGTGDEPDMACLNINETASGA